MKKSILILMVLFCGVAAVGAQFPIRIPKVKTVSYTHLRAHETVLDLVCRLLLEKKKQKTKNKKKKKNKISKPLKYVTIHKTNERNLH